MMLVMMCGNHRHHHITSVPLRTTRCMICVYSYTHIIPISIGMNLTYPMDHMSTSLLYLLEPAITSGLRYQRVTTG